MTTMSLPSAPAAPAGPRPVRWTCAEFHRFGDMGVFEGRRAMLIDGVILEEGPMNPPHAITLELVEQTMKQVAAHRDPDLSLLAKLDQLRTQLRQALTRGSSGSGS